MMQDKLMWNKKQIPCLQPFSLIFRLRLWSHWKWSYNIITNAHKEKCNHQIKKLFSGHRYANLFKVKHRVLWWIIMAQTTRTISLLWRFSKKCLLMMVKKQVWLHHLYPGSPLSMQSFPFYLFVCFQLFNKRPSLRSHPFLFLLF